ncbi:MAG: AraC family transcriptional regulator [Steroidobacteraceae bacterium]
MPHVPSLLARRLAGRCLTAKLALLAGFLALQATAGAALAQTAAPTTPPAAAVQPAAPAPGVDGQVQSLKSDVLDLNRDLFVLEQELLYPANTQVAVFVSMDAGTFFALDSVQLKVDGKEVANYLYTPREVHSLVQGGVQRLYVGNLKVGKHELVAFFTGKGPHNLDYTRGATLDFQKDIGAKYLELTITDEQRKLQPQFRIKDWE